MLRRIAHFLCCTALLMSCADMTGQAKKPHPPEELMNPVFYLEFNPSAAHYDLAPAKIEGLCRHRDLYSDMRVYAHVKEGDSDLYIVSGLGASDNEYAFGLAIWIDGVKCSTADSDWLLNGYRPKNGYAESGNRVLDKMPGFGDDVKVSDPPGTGNFHYEFRSAHEEELLRTLIRDAIQRGTRAYGGDAIFRKQVCPPDVSKERFAYPNSILEQELGAFCSTVPK